MKYAAIVLMVCSAAQPVFSITVPHQSIYGSPANTGTMDIAWPLNNINLSQLQNIITQNPAISQFNLQFPNQSVWGVTPANIQSMTNMFQQEAGTVGLGGKLPDLSFSSLAESAVKANLPQLSINPQGDIQSQMDDVLRQLRYKSIDLSDMLPDWLKRICLAIYDGVYATFDFLGTKLAGLVAR